MAIKLTWWGRQFIEALESQMDAGRLSRGRSYSGPQRIMEFHVEGNVVTATVKGNINYYFDVTETPYYDVNIQFKPLSKATWKRAVKCISKRPAMMMRLFSKELPFDIEECFSGRNISLLPRNPSDIKGECSCPDWANPCKHIAGVYFRLGEVLDRDPIRLLELRGMDFNHLLSELQKTPLGNALALSLMQERAMAKEIMPRKWVFPELSPKRRIRAGQRLNTDVFSFWFGGIDKGEEFSGDCLRLRKRLLTPPVAHAIHLKKEGDSPPFWQKNASFLEAMEEVYSLKKKGF